MTLQISFNLNSTDQPPPWLVPLVESVLQPLFSAPLQGIQVEINVGQPVTPAQTAAIAALMDKIDKIDASVVSVTH